MWKELLILPINVVSCQMNVDSEKSSRILYFSNYTPVSGDLLMMKPSLCPLNVEGSRPALCLFIRISLSITNDYFKCDKMLDVWLIDGVTGQQFVCWLPGGDLLLLRIQGWCSDLFLLHLHLYLFPAQIFLNIGCNFGGLDWTVILPSDMSIAVEQEFGEIPANILIVFTGSEFFHIAV